MRILTCSKWGEHEIGDRCTACRLPHDRHLVGVAAKRGDMLVNPLECQHLVEHRHVTGNVVVLEAHEAERTKSVLDLYQDNVPRNFIYKQYDIYVPINIKQSILKIIIIQNEVELNHSYAAPRYT